MAGCKALGGVGALASAACSTSSQNGWPGTLAITALCNWTYRHQHTHVLHSTAPWHGESSQHGRCSSQPVARLSPEHLYNMQVLLYWQQPSVATGCRCIVLQPPCVNFDNKGSHDLLRVCVGLSSCSCCCPLPHSPGPQGTRSSAPSPCQQGKVTTAHNTQPAGGASSS